MKPLFGEDHHNNHHAHDEHPHEHGPKETGHHYPYVPGFNPNVVSDQISFKVFKLNGRSITKPNNNNKLK